MDLRIECMSERQKKEFLFNNKILKEKSEILNNYIAQPQNLEDFENMIKKANL